jgi:hypothetical protein
VPGEPHRRLHVHLRVGERGVVGAPERMEVERAVLTRARLNQAELSTLRVGGRPLESRQRANDLRGPERVPQGGGVREMPFPLRWPALAPRRQGKTGPGAGMPVRVPPSPQNGHQYVGQKHAVAALRLGARHVGVDPPDGIDVCPIPRVQIGRSCPAQRPGDQRHRVQLRAHALGHSPPTRVHHPSHPHSRVSGPPSRRASADVGCAQRRLLQELRDGAGHGGSAAVAAPGTAHHWAAPWHANAVVRVRSHRIESAPLARQVQLPLSIRVDRKVVDELDRRERTAARRCDGFKRGVNGAGVVARCDAWGLRLPVAVVAYCPRIAQGLIVPGPAVA